MENNWSVLNFEMIFEKTKISVYINYPFKYVNVISDLTRQYLLYRLRTTRAIFVIDFIIHDP